MGVGAGQPVRTGVDNVGVGHDEIGKGVVFELVEQVEALRPREIIEAVKILKQFHLRFEHRVEGRTQEAAERHLLLGQAADPKIYLIDAGRRGRSVQKGHALGVERDRSGARDRKSTRLNSRSLMRRSYAVVGLKNKKAVRNNYLNESQTIQQQRTS